MATTYIDVTLKIDHDGVTDEQLADAAGKLAGQQLIEGRPVTNHGEGPPITMAGAAVIDDVTVVGFKPEDWIA